MELRNGVEWLRIYFVRGASPKGWRPPTTIQDPPCSGWSYAFIIRDGDRAQILCPYSLRVYDVLADCAEIAKAWEPLVFPETAIELTMRRRWLECQKHGWLRNFEAIENLWTLLGWQNEEEEMIRERTPAPELIKPVKRGSKRGKLLQWILEKGGFCTLAQITEHFDIARSNALSYLYNLHKDHGLGYSVNGNDVALWLPPDCASPFSDGYAVMVDDLDFLEDLPSDKCEFKTLSAKEEEGLDFDDDFLEENEDDFLEEKPTKNDDDLWLE